MYKRPFLSIIPISSHLVTQVDGMKKNKRIMHFCCRRGYRYETSNASVPLYPVISRDPQKKQESNKERTRAICMNLVLQMPDVGAEEKDFAKKNQCRVDQCDSFIVLLVVIRVCLCTPFVLLDLGNRKSEIDITIQHCLYEVDRRLGHYPRDP